jgi:ribonuclease T1
MKFISSLAAIILLILLFSAEFVSIELPGSAGFAFAEAAHSAPRQIDVISTRDLPPEALITINLLAKGGPFKHKQDGVIFGNREGILPHKPRGYYKEYTVETPGLSHRGARRIIAGAGGELYYTDDHYKSFKLIKEPR